MSKFVVSADVADHPKVYALAAKLGDNFVSALGRLVLLWAHVHQGHPTGDLSAVSDSDIAKWLCFTGEPATLVDALTRARLLTPERRIHNWTKWKTQIETEPFFGSPPSSPPIIPPYHPPLRFKARVRTEAINVPEDLKPHEPAIRQWLAYHKPYKAVARTALWNKMRTLGTDLPAAIDQAMAAGWAGLFPVKREGGVGMKPTPTPNMPSPEQEARRRAEAAKPPPTPEEVAAGREALREGLKASGLYRRPA